ncbi:MAG: hypothetical protein ACXVAN_04920 [Polyangia bacterium]
MNRILVTQALLTVVLIAGACRRKHEEPTYASDTRTAAPGGEPAATPTENSPPSGASANPLNEPVLPRVDTSARLPDGGTLNGDPRGPRPAEWKPIIDATLPLLQACFDRAGLPFGEIPVTMHYTVELPGYTGAVTAKGEAPKAVLDCCQTVVEELKFPQYRGPKVERDLAFTWFKRDPKARPPDGGAAAAATRK